MKKLFIIIEIIILLSIKIFSSNSNIGTTSAAFTKITVSPRIVSLGDADTGLTDINSVLNNPAGIGNINQKEISFGYSEWLLETNLGYLALSFPLNKSSNVGFGLKYFSSGDIEKIDNTGQKLGSKYSSTSMLVSLIYACKITKNISFGSAIKYISEKIDDKSAETPTIDFGTNISLSDKIRFGAVAQNLFGEMKFISEKANLPFIIKVGGCYNVLDNFLAVLDVNIPNDNDLSAGFGLEYGLNFTELIIPFRVGYRTIPGIDGLTGISFGIGFNYKKFSNLDFSFRPYGELGSSLNAGLSFSF